MALSSQLIWEVRTTGNSANGGGFRGTALAGTPAAPTVTGASTGGTVSGGTYYACLTYTPGGEARESPKSAETAVTLTGSTSKFTVTKPSDPGNGATWNLYVGTTSGGPYFPQGTALAIGTDRVVTATPPTTGTQPPGADYSVQDAPQVTYADLAIGATNTTATSAASPFTPAMVGNLLNQVSGTGFTAGRFEVTGVTAAGVATFDRALGTANSTGGAGRLGGAVDGPATINAATVAGNILFRKYSATPTTLTTGLANGTLAQIVSYDTTRTVNNTDANRSTFRAGASLNPMVSLTGGNQRVANFVFDNPSAFSGLVALQVVSNIVVSRCQFADTTTAAILLNGQGTGVEDCEFVRASGTASLWFNAAGWASRCLARSCSAPVLVGNSGASLNGFIAYNSTGNGFYGSGGSYVGCVCYGSTSTGFAGQPSTSFTTYDRCLAYGNGGSGWDSGTSRNARLVNCRGGGNASGNFSTSRFSPDINEGFVALTGDPFANAAGLDFSLNNVAGAGASCRGIAAGIPYGGATTGYPDAGAAQSAGGGGATYFSH